MHLQQWSDKIFPRDTVVYGSFPNFFNDTTVEKIDIIFTMFSKYIGGKTKPHKSI